MICDASIQDRAGTIAAPALTLGLAVQIDVLRGIARPARRPCETPTHRTAGGP